MIRAPGIKSKPTVQPMSPGEVRKNSSTNLYRAKSKHGKVRAFSDYAGASTFAMGESVEGIDESIVGIWTHPTKGRHFMRKEKDKDGRCIYSVSREKDKARVAEKKFGAVEPHVAAQWLRDGGFKPDMMSEAAEFLDEARKPGKTDQEMLTHHAAKAAEHESLSKHHRRNSNSEEALKHANKGKSPDEIRMLMALRRMFGEGNDPMGPNPAGGENPGGPDESNAPSNSPSSTDGEKSENGFLAALETIAIGAAEMFDALNQANDLPSWAEDQAGQAQRIIENLSRALAQQIKDGQKNREDENEEGQGDPEGDQGDTQTSQQKPNGGAVKESMERPDNRVHKIKISAWKNGDENSHVEKTVYVKAGDRKKALNQGVKKAQALWPHDGYSHSADYVEESWKTGAALGASTGANFGAVAGPVGAGLGAIAGGIIGGGIEHFAAKLKDRKVTPPPATDPDRAAARRRALMGRIAAVAAQKGVTEAWGPRNGALRGVRPVRAVVPTLDDEIEQFKKASKGPRTIAKIGLKSRLANKDTSEEDRKKIEDILSSEIEG